MALLLSIGLIAALAPTAQAQTTPTTPTELRDVQCFPEDFIDYPPTGPAVDIIPGLALFSAQFSPGTENNTLVISGLIPGDFYCGRLMSTPITLPVIQADANGKLNYKVATPSSFELNALHHVDIYHAASLVGALDFCVKLDGSIGELKGCGKASSTHGALAKTGNNIWDVVRIALVLLAIGVLAVYVRRRRSMATPTG